MIAGREFYIGNFDFQTIGLPALETLEMDMIMAMVHRCARIIAKGIFHASFVVKDLMNEPLIQESFEGPINGNAVEIVADLSFDVGVG